MPASASAATSFGWVCGSSLTQALAEVSRYSAMPPSVDRPGQLLAMQCMSSPARQARQSPQVGVGCRMTVSPTATFVTAEPTLRKLSLRSRLTISPEAMQLLTRSSWPGNAEQLWQVMRQVVQSRRSGEIAPKDLPPECWTVSRRLLSPLESLERDAIVQALLDCRGNKARAAESLGMSRATIYRKIREYAIVIPAS